MGVKQLASFIDKVAAGRSFRTLGPIEEEVIIRILIMMLAIKQV